MGRRKTWEKLDIPNKLDKLAEWCREGATDKEIAKSLGVGLTTFYQWQKDYPEIREVISVSKPVVDFQVENQLLKRALGYRYKETKQIRINSEIVREEVTEKECVPDVTAIKWWLRNRRPDKWGDKQNAENESKLDIEKLIDEWTEKAIELEEEQAREKLDRQKAENGATPDF